MLIYLLRLPGTSRTVIPSGARTVQKNLVKHLNLYNNYPSKHWMDFAAVLNFVQYTEDLLNKQLK